jgi:hypothetical protein
VSQCLIFIYVLVVLGLKLKASPLPGKLSTTQATPQALFVLGIFEIMAHKLIVQVGLKP